MLFFPGDPHAIFRRSCPAFASGKDVIIVLPIYGILKIYNICHISIIIFLVSYVSDTLFRAYILNAQLVDRKGSIAIIITPLIALMIDQKQWFEHKGMSVEFVGDRIIKAL